MVRLWITSRHMLCKIVKNKLKDQLPISIRCAEQSSERGKLKPPNLLAG